MTFNLLYTNLTAPLGNMDVSASLVGEAGMIGYINANIATGDPEIQLGTSGTTGLLGIIDDSKNSSFSATVVNEVVLSGQTTLSHASLILQSGELCGIGAGGSGTATISSSTNGTIVVSGVSTEDKTFKVSYNYIIPGKAGDDTTLASGKCTIWLQEGEYATDIYEIANASGTKVSDYVVGAPLYVADNTYNHQGRLTNRVGSQIIGYVTKSPTSGNPTLNFYKKIIS